MKLFSIKQALKFGICNTLDHFFLILGIFCIALLTNLLAFTALIIGFFGTSISSFLGDRIYITQLTMPNLLIGGIIAVCIATSIEAWLSLGILRVALALYDTNSAHFSDLFKGNQRIGSFLLAKLFYNLMVIVGLAFFIIPGIYCALVFWYYPQAIVDKDLDAFAALSFSRTITRTALPNLLAFIIIAGLMMSLASALFMVGMVFVLPIVILANTYIYRKLVYAHEVIKNYEEEYI